MRKGDENVNERRPPSLPLLISLHSVLRSRPRSYLTSSFTHHLPLRETRSGEVRRTEDADPRHEW